MNRLDQFQQKIVDDEYKGGKCVLVHATAGSGKTHCIISKAVKLSETINPKQIVAIAFGNKAARELRERYKRMSGKGGIVCSTIHSLCYKLNKEYFGEKRTVLTESKAITQIKEIVEELIKEEKVDRDEIRPRDLATKWYKQYEESRINLRPSVPFTENKELNKEILKRIIDKREVTETMDFCDMQYRFYQNIKRDQKKLQEIRNDFKAFMIDEAQDIDFLQISILKEITKEAYTIYVGDRMQTLYMFRFANPKYFSSEYLADYYDDIVEYNLQNNYRSTKNIVNISNLVRIVNMYKEIKAIATKESVRGSVSIVKVANNIQEGTKIAQIIENYKSNGVELGDIYIISRTNLYVKSIVEPALVRANIPYILMSNQSKKLTEKNNVNAIMCMIGVIVNEKDYYNLFELATYIKGIGESTAEKLMEAYNTNSNNLTDLQKEKYNQVIELRDDLVKLQKYKVAEDHEEIVNIIFRIAEKHLNYLEYFMSEKEVYMIKNTMNFWIHYYLDEGYFKIIDIFEMILNEVQSFDIDENKNAVKIHTIHSSKGLEFPIVIAGGFNRGRKAPDYYGDEDFMMYVQLSRAKDKLHIIDSERYITQDGRNIKPVKNTTLKKILEKL